MMGFIEPEQAEQAPAAISLEQEQAVEGESEAAPREEEVVPEGTAEAETGGIVLEEELERQGPALTNETLRDWVERWCSGKKKGLPPISTWNTSLRPGPQQLENHKRDAARLGGALVRRRPRGLAAHLDVEHQPGHGHEQSLLWQI